MPALRQHSANFTDMVEPTAFPTGDHRSASAIDFGQSADINFHLPTGEPNTPSRSNRNRDRKSANGTRY
jgi:hypothetical protein